MVEERLERTKAFYESPRGALIYLTGISTFKEERARSLSSWSFPEDLHPYMDTIIEAAELHWKQRDEINDDLLPSVCPWFGIAEHSAFMGGDVHFARETSFQIPFITDWDKLDSIVFSEDNKWFKMLMEGFRYLKEKTQNRFLLRQRGAAGPMDMANAMRGNDFFSDFYDYPNEIHRLLAICENGMHWYFEHQKKIVGELDEGWLTGFSAWMPGNSAGHVSEDASVMCSPVTYREFGRPYMERFCAAHDHVFIHLHGAGKHAFPDIISIPQFTIVELTNDPNSTSGIELLKDYEELMEGRIIMLHLSRKEIEENRDFLKTKKVIITYFAESIDDAKSMISSLRSL